MGFGADSPLRRFKWHIVIIYAALIAVFVLGVFTDVFHASQTGSIPQLVWLFGALVLLIAVITMLSRVFKIASSLEANSVKLEEIAVMLEKSYEVLVQISRDTRLSEMAKTIASRDVDRQSLREAVFDKLQQEDFDSACEIIDEIAHSTAYSELAEQLRTEVDKYRAGTGSERANQVITHIETLLANYQWVEAGARIEALIEIEPDSEQAKAMRQKLIDKKQERKKILLTAWDDAVKRQATDRSLEILKKLDQYLTPNEGLALQEAAKDVFKSKLHNLGVQFSLAVSGKQWARALKTGREIIRDFPNSKMAEEIREKIDILKQKAK